MSRSESLELREQTLSRSGASPTGRDNRSSERDLYEDGSSPARTLSNRKKASVLVGCSLLQLPIWGFSMSYGVFQEYYSSNWPLRGSDSASGVIGTTSNGVIYLAMPFLFAAFSRRWARFRLAVALVGIALTGLGFLLSSYCNYVWQLVITQGVVAALGSALLYSPSTLALGESFTTGNRAVAYSIAFASKNVVGSTCPYILRALLDTYGFRNTLRIWTAIVTGTSLIAIFMMPINTSSISSGSFRPRRTVWHFLKHQTFYIYSIATMMQSCGYGLPQTYINSYAHDVASLSSTSATLLLTIFNIPGIISCPLFGYLSDNKHYPLSATSVTCLSSITSAMSVFLFWGLAPPSSMAMLALFSITFGFFASAYSSTWGNILKEMEREAADRNEAVDTGVVLGLLNGARGLGYVSGGLAGVPLLESGQNSRIGRFGYGTEYGPLIIFTGLSVAFGGWSVMWKCKSLRSLFQLEHS